MSVNPQQNVLIVFLFMEMIIYPSMNVNLVSNRINAVEWLSQNTRLNLNVPSEGVREG